MDAEVTAPDGKTLTVPGFHEVPMRLETRRGSERLVPSGPPRVSGSVHAHHGRDPPARPEGRRQERHRPIVSPGAEGQAGRSPGFVRVARQAPHYFAFDSGRPFIAIGENVCWSSSRTPLADYAAWLKGLGSSGRQLGAALAGVQREGPGVDARAHPQAGHRNLPGPGPLFPGNAWRLDEVMRLAHENGVYLMFCLGTYGEFTEGGYFNEGCWVSNPYNARNGGPCAIRPTSGRTRRRGSSTSGDCDTSSPGGAATRTCSPGSSGTRFPQPARATPGWARWRPT